ncbi:hypothetical protein [Arcanobacterium buesumense]|uniref:hypothetical protein n=1 Tax=Arcanobacterium buesumense TaxID=2722751 RepID=UPI001B3AAE3E|nr:hypothetical protein [Arcanobacterium buesumense]
MTIEPVFRVCSWPPGRACGDGAPEYKFYRGHYGDFSQEIQDLLNSLPRVKKMQLQAILVTVLTEAKLGQLTPVHHDGAGHRIGDVDVLEITDRKILEIRLENQFEGSTKLFPGKRLRIYFCEPLAPHILLLLLCEPKLANQQGLAEQDQHAKNALDRAYDWHSQYYTQP